MLKRFFSFALMFLSIICMNAQQPTQLPLDPKVLHGQLANGLTYYILHNEEPKERANFYIAQNVGSTLETPEQLGLAHFLEHMAFNGTKHYPGKNMLNYLQTKGLRFGADINAYTSFDKTVYNVNNVNTKDQALMDSVLLVLYDWSCAILLEEDEINAERGIIQEEWRMRNDASTRFFTQALKEVYSEYQYQQMPIGSMDVVMNFPPQAIRDYYHKWYRPDQQAIVIVGDFDAPAMEAKVKEMFADIPMPENAAPRTYAPVSDNEKPIVVTFEDAEQQYPQIMVMFKEDPIPVEYRSTDMGVVQDLLKQAFAMMVNNRLSEYAQNPDCPYVYAGTSFGDFLVSKTKAAFQIVIIPKADTDAAFIAAMEIVARACKTGFNASEYKRVSDEILASVEKRYNERDKTNSDVLATKIISNFTENDPYLGAETDYQIVQQILPMLPVEVFNQVGAELLTPDNQVIMVLQPKQEGYTLPSAEAISGTLQNVINAEYEAYVDEVITEPLIAELPAKGSVVATAENNVLGATELTLSNGAKVIVKPTDFAADEILLQVVNKDGGKRHYDASQAPNLAFVESAFEASKYGPFDVNKLQKYLAGKRVSLNYFMGNRTNGLKGRSTVKDLPTLMELLYTAFTNINPDAEAWGAMEGQMRTILANADNNPNFIFQRELAKARYNDNPMTNEEDLNTLNASNYDEMFNLAKQSLNNAADFTFIFTGNVDVETLRPLLEQYVASLPSTGKRSEIAVKTPIMPATGIVNNVFEQEMSTPSTIIYDICSGTIEPNVANNEMISLLGDILGNIYTETLREQEGGTYSPGAAGFLDLNNGRFNILSYIQTNGDVREKMQNRANEELMKLMNEGATAEQFNKVKGAAISVLENDLRTNSYWNNQIQNYVLGFDTVSNALETLQNLTLEQFNAWMKNLYNGNDRLDVIMVGVPATSK